MSGLANGGGGRWNASRRREGDEPRSRCCARCKTPYGCGNGPCACHTPAGAAASLRMVGGAYELVTDAVLDQNG